MATDKKYKEENDSLLFHNSDKSTACACKNKKKEPDSSSSFFSLQ
jgi:hypothetical protein